VLIWLHRHAQDLRVNFALPMLADGWARAGVAVLQWFELWLFLELALSVAKGLERTETRDVGHSARATALVGFLMWSLQFLLLSSWRFGWARPDARRFGEFVTLSLYSHALLALTAFQVTVVCILVTRACRGALAAARRTADEPELLKTRIDPFDDRRDRWFDGP
jgi:hypothetical protein